MSPYYRALVVEDAINEAFLIVSELERGGLNERLETAAGFAAAVRARAGEFIVCDYQLLDFDGLTALAVLREAGRKIPLLMFADALPQEEALRLLHAGAREVILKQNRDRLAWAIKPEAKAARPPGREPWREILNSPA